MISGTPHSPWKLERAVKWVVLALLAYWLAYALVVPVTGWDSQTHNLARLLIARDGGLFGNHGWNTPVQDSFPWSFDAVHYPFLLLGFGCALPSFACFIGALVIIFRLVKESHCATAAWWCCFSMLALPTLMYQATANKNDIPILFGAACWLYALGYWSREKRAVYLCLMALALGFTAGAKSTGVAIAAALSVFTYWRIGWNRRALVQFSLFLAAGLLLLGSVETYIHNLKVYGHVLGPPILVQMHINRDGARGAAANAVRYFFGLMNAGVNVPGPSPFCAWLAVVCRGFLRLVHLKDAGYVMLLTDEKLDFMKDGVEASSDYGPVGMLAVICSLWVVFAGPVRDVRWKLAGAGFLCLGLTCWTIGWQPWCNRFLVLPVVLFTLVFMLGIVRRCNTKLYRWAAVPLFILLLFSAVVFPLYSYNRGPKYLRLSIVHRDEMATRENPRMLEVERDIRALPGSAGPALVLLHAGYDDWVLPILQIPLTQRALAVMPAPQLTAQALALAKTRAAGRPIYILVMGRQLEPDPAKGLFLIKKYPGEGYSLLALKEPAM